MDPATTLGQRLLSKETLTAAEVKREVETARSDGAAAAKWARLRAMVTELQFAVRSPDREWRERTVKRIVGDLWKEIG